MPSGRRFAALLTCAGLLASPASPQVRSGASKHAATVLQIPAMPKLAGLTPDSANKLLGPYHRQIDSIYPAFSKSAAGTIISQSPDSGSAITAGQYITVRVATVRVAISPSVVAAYVPRMPKLVGLTPDSANSLLSRYDRRIDSVFPLPSDSPAGTIFWQSPDPGTVIKAGLSIVARVATHDDLATRVPGLVGLTNQEVAESLRSARLLLGSIDSVTDPAHVGRVAQQDPPAGKVVKRGTPVAISYGKADPRVVVPRVVVPEVRGMSPEDASTALERAGLSLGHVDSLPGDSRTVIRQAPHENTLVPPRSRVEIRYTYPSRTLVAVPDLSGNTADAASHALGQVGLTLGPVDSAPTDGDAGTVMAQQPLPQTRVDSGTSVSIAVGVARQVIVPSVVGLTRQDAEATLSTAQLRVGAITQAETDGRADVILFQKPDSGIVVRPGTSVDLGVSVARRKIAVPDVVVPDLGNQRLEAARSLLEARQLTLGGVQYDARKGGDSTVYWQNPPKEARRRPGTAVTVRIGVPTPAVAVPKLVGLDSVHAWRVLADSGFRLGAVRMAESDSQAGTVLSQSPGAGAPSTRGTQVSVLLARPRVLLVPDVLGMKAGDAESALAAVGLAVRSDSQLAFGADGIVMVQTPPGGAVGARGLVVRLTVGEWPTAWLWMAGIAGSVGAMAAASGTMGRRFRDRHWRRRLTYVPLSGAGTAILEEPAEPLLQPDLQLQPVSSPATHALDVDGPLFPEDSS